MSDIQQHHFIKREIGHLVAERVRTRGYDFVLNKDYEIKKPFDTDLYRYQKAYCKCPSDPHLNEGEGSRNRRYARFHLVPKTGEMRIYAHAPFFQAAKFDHLYGDIHRKFAHLDESLLRNRFFLNLIKDDFYLFPHTSEGMDQPWEISTHLIRISAQAGNDKGRPAPEGIHQDGYHYGVARLFRRENIEGAESRVHNLSKTVIDRQTLTQPLDTLYMNDRAIFHSVEPFFARDDSKPAHRDVLISLYQPVSESPQRKEDPISINEAGIASYLGTIN